MQAPATKEEAPSAQEAPAAPETPKEDSPVREQSTIVLGETPAAERSVPPTEAAPPARQQALSETVSSGGTADPAAEISPGGSELASAAGTVPVVPATISGSQPLSSVPAASAQSGPGAGCLMTSLTASLSARCASALLVGQQEPVTVLFEPASASGSQAAVRTSASGSKGRAATAVDSDPPAQSPGPSPGGSGAPSAAAGSGGSSSSTSLTLFSLSLHFTPSATRLLHLSQPEWRTSFAALILERPD